MKYQKRTDSNHQLIRDALRKIGCEVHDRSALGCGIPDLEVRTRNGKVCWIEIKSDDGERLTPAELEFFDWWHHCAFVLRTVEDAIAQVQNFDMEDDK